MSDDGNDGHIRSLFGENVKKPKDPIQEIIETLNLKHAALKIGATHWMMSDPDGDWDLGTRKSFVEMYENYRLTVQTNSATNVMSSKDIPWTDLWLKAPNRRKYDGIAFDPDNRVGKKIYNTWKGFAISGAPGNCALTLNYIRNIICNKEEIKFKKFMQYWAHMVQKPGEKPEYAIILKGLKGVGKSFFLDIMQVLIDGRVLERTRHCYRTSNSEDIYGRFRDHLQSKIALFCEEVTFGGDKRHVGTINDYVTGKTLKAEKKNGPILTLKNVMRICMTANPGWTVPATADERRYEIYYVNNEHQQDHGYFAKIMEELMNGGYEAFMYELEHFDIFDFNCREALRTDALVDEIKQGFSVVERWYDDTLMRGQVQFIEEESKIDFDGHMNACIGRDILHKWYEQFARKINSRATTLSKTEFGILIRQYLPLVENGKIVMNDDGRRVVSIVGEKKTGKEPNRQYCYILPSLVKCRELWDFRLKRKYEWPEPNEWEQPEFGVM